MGADSTSPTRVMLIKGTNQKGGKEDILIPLTIRECDGSDVDDQQ